MGLCNCTGEAIGELGEEGEVGKLFFPNNLSRYNNKKKATLFAYFKSQMSE